MINGRPSYCVGVNVFVLHNGKILLGKRKNCAGEGTWGLPGGHLEEGEAMVDAGIRELMEETGLSAGSMKFIHLINDRRQDQHYIQTGFLAEGVEGEVILAEPDKCECWEWFNVDDLPTEIFHGHITLINAYTSNQIFVD